MIDYNIMINKYFICKDIHTISAITIVNNKIIQPILLLTTPLDENMVINR